MKILFCGLGSIGQRHVRLLHQIDPSIEIIAYRTKKGALKDIEPFVYFHRIRLYSSLEQALAEKPDAAFITNPNSLHIETAIQCAKQGTHLFIEKPLSNRLEGLIEFEKIVNQKHLIVMIGFMMRYNLGLQKIKQYLTQKVIGPLVTAQLINSEYLPNWRPWEDYRQSYSARKELGGGIIFNFSHELDYASWLFGSITKVYCQSKKSTSLETDVEDSADMLVTTKYDTTLSIHLDHISDPPIRQAMVIGEKGRIMWDFYAASVHCSTSVDPKGELYTYDTNRDLMFLKEIQEFLNCLKNKKQPSLNLKTAKENLILLLACHQSAKKNKQIIL